MSTSFFSSGTKKYEQFIPSYTSDSVKTSPSIRKRKRQISSSNGSPPYDTYLHAPPSPTSTTSTSSLCSSSTLNSSSSSSSLSSSQRKPPSQRKSHCSHRRQHSLDDKALMTLEDELDYTQDSLATLNVMFGSLRQAYVTGEPQLTHHPTRLGAMEKELLSAYDDLELQVIHLDRHIQKLESSWRYWKSSNQTYLPSPPPLPPF
ncbi:unnamed protein product [Absidia cylindrospora]